MRFEFEAVDEEPIIEPINIWSSRCFIVNNPYHDFLKPYLVNHIYSDAKASDVAIKSQTAHAAKTNLIESDFDFLDRDDANVQTLHVYVTELIETIATDVNQPFLPEDAELQATITESWYHVTKNGGYHDAHTHPNCSWCGIYYLDIGESGQWEKNGINRFYDPRVNAGHFLDAGSQYLNESGVWDIQPEDGKIIIFPSYLRHSALPYFGQRDRIVIAFNARVDFLTDNDSINPQE